MKAAGAEHPAVAAWKAMSDETLAQIDPATLPGQSPQQDALRRLFLRQRLDYHRAHFMYSAITLATTEEQARRAAEAAAEAMPHSPSKPKLQPRRSGAI